LSTFAIGIRRPVLADVGARALPGLLIRVLPVLVGTALTAAAAQIAFYLPGNPVPITGQTFGVLVVGAALGPVRAVASMLLYVLLSILGLPLLAPNASGAHTTGTAVLHLPTFGYLIGFVVAAALLGLAATIYLFGATWLALDLHMSARTALHLGVTPFLIGDLVKAVAAAVVLPGAWWALRSLDR
jgi:biotin transport system substrate-specific component